MDLRLIGNSCLPRYRITRAEVVRTPPGTLNTPDYDGLTLAKLSAKDNTAIFALMGLVRDCARRGGTDILGILRDILQYRLLGGGPGEKAHKLADKFMTCVHNTDHCTSHQTRGSIYVNNPRDPGNKQRAREANRGDLSALSTGFRRNQRLAAKAKMANLTLTGAS